MCLPALRALSPGTNEQQQQLAITDELLALNEKQAPIFYEGRRRGGGACSGGIILFLRGELSLFDPDVGGFYLEEEEIPY